jgi:phage anti-repressor protein
MLRTNRLTGKRASIKKINGRILTELQHKLRDSTAELAKIARMEKGNESAKKRIRQEKDNNVI